MPRNKNLLKDRDSQIKTRFKYHRKKNPKWTMEAVINEVAKEFYLSGITIAKVLKKAGDQDVPAPSTIYRKQVV